MKTGNRGTGSIFFFERTRDGKNLTGQVFSILVLSSTETAIDRDGLVKLAEKEPFQTRTLTC